MLLTGTALLTKIQELGNAPRDQVAIACGYVNDKTGKPAFTAFYEAMLQAKGLQLAPASTARKASRGKQPSFKATVAKNGTVPIGGAYTSLIGAKPGDTITIAHEGGKLTLEAIAASAVPVSAPEATVACSAPVGAAAPAAGAPEAALAAA